MRLGSPNDQKVYNAVTELQNRKALSYRDAVHRVAKEFDLKVSSVYGICNRAKRAGDEPVSAPKRENFYVSRTSTLFDDEGQVRAQWVREDKVKNDWINTIEYALEAVKDIRSIKPVQPNTATIDDLMTFYPLVDLHVGLSASSVEWSLDEAYDRYLQVYTDLINRSPNSTQAVIANIGDFTHIDTLQGTTTAGTQVGSSASYRDVIHVSMMLMMAIIEMVARKHQNVTLYYLSGNHDEATAIVMQAALSAIYKNNPHIHISPSSGHYSVFKFGVNAIGLTHGDTVKMDALPLLMAADYAQVWAATKYRVWHTGHIHHRTVQEFTGCTVESHRTAAPKDEWTSKRGYRSQRQVQSIIYGEMTGEYARNMINL